MNEENYVFPIDKMVGEFDDFIGIWRNFVPKQFCAHAIERFETITNGSLHVDIGEGSKQFDSKLGRHDKQLIFNDYDSEITTHANEYLKCCLKHYCMTYDQLLSVRLQSYTVKGQKTPPQGGYHNWHYEIASVASANRELVWTIYLNDMPDGEAETEFLYQKRRVKPEAGLVCIFPAGMTHVHRGNTVFTKDKYILTGWAHKVH